MTDDGDRIDPKILGAHEVPEPDVGLDPTILDAFGVPEPSPGAGDRFSAALVGASSVADGGARRRAIAGIASIAAIAAVVALLAWPSRVGGSGASSPAERTTASLAGRGVAVIEAGARLAWEVDAIGAARLHQDAGDVFYRVEPGAPFVVATPAGDVTVRGTCFRVELVAAGAALVTVYEGRVAVANHHGQLEVAAGERAIATSDAVPRTMPPPGTPPMTVWQSLGDLTARDRAQRERIAALEAQLAAAQGVEAIGPARPMKHPFDPSQAELVELAKQCNVIIDVPPVAGSTLMDQIIDDGMRTADLTADERAAVRRVIAKFQASYQGDLVELYRELTGEDAALDPLTAILEITQKSTPTDLSAAYEKISAERAGLRPVQADAKAPVIERYLRFAGTAADSFERQLAAEIGAARARAFRRTWGGVNLDPGCPKQGHP